jgi:hypothetical protein
MKVKLRKSLDAPLSNMTAHGDVITADPATKLIAWLADGMENDLVDDEESVEVWDEPTDFQLLMGADAIVDDYVVDTQAGTLRIELGDGRTFLVTCTEVK